MKNENYDEVVGVYGLNCALLLSKHLSTSNLPFNESELCLHLLDIVTIRVYIKKNKFFSTLINY